VYLKEDLQDGQHYMQSGKNYRRHSQLVMPPPAGYFFMPASQVYSRHRRRQQLSRQHSKPD
jgi:2-oxoglutarate dehydrogenase complex dehydrogenase (E1) component-like enzyme